MKKLLSILLAILLVVGVCACESKSNTKEIIYFDFTTDELLDILSSKLFVHDSLYVDKFTEFEPIENNEEYTKYSIVNKDTPNNSVDVLEFTSHETDGIISSITLESPYVTTEYSENYIPNITTQFLLVDIIGGISKTSNDENLEFVWDWWKPEEYSDKYEDITDATWKNINYNVTYNNDKKSIKVSLFPSKE